MADKGSGIQDLNLAVCGSSDNFATWLPRRLTSKCTHHFQEETAQTFMQSDEFGDTGGPQEMEWKVPVLHVHDPNQFLVR